MALLSNLVPEKVEEAVDYVPSLSVSGVVWGWVETCVLHRRQVPAVGQVVDYVLRPHVSV